MERAGRRIEILFQYDTVQALGIGGSYKKLVGQAVRKPFFEDLREAFCREKGASFQKTTDDTENA